MNTDITYCKGEFEIENIDGGVPSVCECSKRETCYRYLAAKAANMPEYSWWLSPFECTNDNFSAYWMAKTLSTKG